MGDGTTWETGAVFITGFPAGMLACNCYVLAQRPGADAIVVDPGQRAMDRLRRILDEHRLTPAAVLLTHGHLDHIWSAQKVADTYGCAVYIHPEDRGMLTDPIKGFGPALLGSLSRLAFGVLLSEPKQLVELDRDGQTLDFGGVSVTVDHSPGHTRGRWCSGSPGRRMHRPPRRFSRAIRCSGPRWAAPTCPVAADVTCSRRS
ncbi:beta-lactamase domain-containing protein [Mycolicibacterium conceptionense]|uniref:Beta-lactamase domain-containing protein n=1 Tax=Mycolicibacterium conceptionense TaxID=451644 RepID=A0A0U1E0Q7_9MYCO|nr:beta-lactamase domain-containing protein [Mycolicibacterium conceptionense]